jgi:hypothetical protein
MIGLSSECMHGFGLWRLGRFEDAVGIFDRMPGQSADSTVRPPRQ